MHIRPYNKLQRDHYCCFNKYCIQTGQLNLSWQQENKHFAYMDFFSGNVAGLLPAITERILRALTSTWSVIFITNGYHAVSKHMWHLSTGQDTHLQYPHPPWCNSPQRARASSLSRLYDHTWHTTAGKTPLDKWLAQFRDIYLTTHNIHKRQTYMLPAGFQPTVPPSKQLQTCTLEHVATEISFVSNSLQNTSWKKMYSKVI